MSMEKMGGKTGIQCVTCAAWFPEAYSALDHEREIHNGRTASYVIRDDESLRCNCSGMYNHTQTCPAGIQERQYEPYRRRAAERVARK